MHQIAYTSRATILLSPDGLERLSAQSYEWNEKAGITGLLVFDRKRYMQVIEGDAYAVKQLMARIEIDCRHDQIIYLADCPIELRGFEGWALESLRFKENATRHDFLADVTYAVRNVSDIRLKAAFIGFAALSH